MRLKTTLVIGPTHIVHLSLPSLLFPFNPSFNFSVVFLLISLFFLLDILVAVPSSFLCASVSLQFHPLFSTGFSSAVFSVRSIPFFFPVSVFSSALFFFSPRLFIIRSVAEARLSPRPPRRLSSLSSVAFLLCR